MSLPTSEEIIQAFKSQDIRPTGRIMEGWTGSGVHCACALKVVALARGQFGQSLEEIFGPDSRSFMLGWDNPDCLFKVTMESNGALYLNPIAEQGARAWWDCVKAGLVPNHYEIPNSDIDKAPGWYRGEEYIGPVALRKSNRRIEHTGSD